MYSSDLDINLIHDSLDSRESARKQHLDRFSRFSQHTRVTNTDKQTDTQTTLSATSLAMPPPCCACMRCGLNIYCLHLKMSCDSRVWCIAVMITYLLEIRKTVEMQSYGTVSLSKLCWICQCMKKYWSKCTLLLKNI